MKEKYKVAILATYVSLVDRGAETFVVELTKKLRNSFDVTVYASGLVDSIRESIVVVKVKKSVLTRFQEKLYFNFKPYKKLCDRLYCLIPEVMYQKSFSKQVYKQFLLKEQFDIVFPNNGVPGAIYAKRVRELFHTPFIYTGHGGIGPGERLILKTEPDCYVALSYPQYDWASAFSKNVKLIHNGVDCNYFKPDRSYNKEYSAIQIVLSVGALTSFKRHSLTIDAVSRLGKNVQLIILGKGELEDQLRTYGERILGSRFTLKSVPYGEIKNHYAGCDVFVLPSLNEPFGIVYLEAMAMNKPVVAHIDATRVEIVGNAGILCDCTDPDSYSEAIRECLLKDWGNTPRERALTFDWGVIAKEYYNLIKELVK